MIKYLFIVINSLSLLFFSLFKDDNTVTITNNIPSTITVGQEVVVDIRINKGTMNGFAKLQLELPEGIVIKESENNGATYSDEGGIAKWVWAVLPSENEIVVRVLFIATDAALGVKTILAKYSYVENNVKQTIDMVPAQVTVVPGTGIAAMTSSTVDANATPGDTALKSSSMPMLSTNSEPPGNINVVRAISKINDTEYLVTLKIKKGITKGFAKYSDDVISRITAKSVKTDGSSFSVGDGKIKFVWVTVPEKDELEISYTITGNFASAVTLNGEYSYLEANQSKKYKVTPETISPTSDPAATLKDEKLVSPQPESPKKDAEVTEAKPTETKKADEPVEKLSTDVVTTQPNTVTEKNDGATVFQVQIGAFTSGKTDASTLKQKFKITEAIKSDMQGGFSKFMIGSHSEYKDARYHKETVKDVNGIKSAFVVAYNGSKRITVQEALMISNQKWFK